MRFLTTTRQKKIFRVQHLDPGDIHFGFILLPVGYSYNADISKAKKGDILRLVEGEDKTIICVRKIRADKPEADLLCMIRYGIRIKGAMERWKSNAKLEGHGAKAISEEECLWVIYELDEHD